MADPKPHKSEKLRILGQDWTVHWYKGDLPDNPSDKDQCLRGLCYAITRTIHIYDGSYRTLVHEIFEALREELDLEFNHQTLQTLEGVFWAVMEDNNLWAKRARVK